MSAQTLGDLDPVPNRPGRTARDLIGSAQGFDSLFVTETVMEPRSAIPLHTHPVEEGWVVLDGELTFFLADDTIRVSAESTVRVPANVPHAVINDGASAARALTAAPWNRSTFYRDATTYLEGQPRVD